MSKYKISTSDYTIVFNSISAEDADRYHRIIKQTDSAEAEEMLFLSIVEDKSIDIESLNAGVIPTVLYCAFHISGFITIDESVPDNIEKARTRIASSLYHSLLYPAIIKTQPGYTLDMLRSKSLNDLMELFALSEIILGKDIVNIEEMRKTIAESKQNKVSPSAGGIAGVTSEELDLVKSMIEAEEFNSEIF